MYTNIFIVLDIEINCSLNMDICGAFAINIVVYRQNKKKIKLCVAARRFVVLEFSVNSKNMFYFEMIPIKLR